MMVAPGGLRAADHYLFTIAVAVRCMILFPRQPVHNLDSQAIRLCVLISLTIVVTTIRDYESLDSQRLDKVSTKVIAMSVIT